MKPFDANNINLKALPENMTVMSCQQPTKPRWAIQINNEEGFQIRNERGIRELGIKGDYLILGPNGSKNICPQSDFANEYVLISGKDLVETEIERLKNLSALPLSSDDGCNLYVQSISDVQDGIPGAIHLYREDPNGEDTRIEYHYESQFTVDGKLVDDPTDQVIAEKDGQTHDPNN
jgi:hypothetical protein